MCAARFLFKAELVVTCTEKIYQTALEHNARRLDTTGLMDIPRKSDTVTVLLYTLVLSLRIGTV